MAFGYAQQDSLELPRLVEQDEAGHTKWTGRGRIVGAPAPTTMKQQPTWPHDPNPNPPQEVQHPIEPPPDPEAFFQPTMMTMVQQKNAARR